MLLYLQFYCLLFGLSIDLFNGQITLLAFYVKIPFFNKLMLVFIPESRKLELTKFVLGANLPSLDFGTSASGEGCDESFPY